MDTVNGNDTTSPEAGLEETTTGASLSLAAGAVMVTSFEYAD
jgi:hypothetical protein